MFLIGSKIQTGLVLIAILIGTHGAAFVGGYFKGASSTREEWAVERAEMQAAAAINAAHLRERGDRLAAELVEARAVVRTEYIEVIRVVREKASATRACFSPDITEILNRNSTIRETVVRPDAPPVVRVHVTAPATPAAPSFPAGGTSERAAAEWVAHAQAEHSACRAQVAKLADWIRTATAGGKK